MKDFDFLFDVGIVDRRILQPVAESLVVEQDAGAGRDGWSRSLVPVINVFGIWRRGHFDILYRLRDKVTSVVIFTERGRFKAHQESGEQTSSLLKHGKTENGPAAQGDIEAVPGDCDHQQNPGHTEARVPRRTLSRQRKASQKTVEY